MARVINEGLQSVMQKHHKKMTIVNAYGGAKSNITFFPKGYFSGLDQGSPTRRGGHDLNQSVYHALDSKRSNLTIYNYSKRDHSNPRQIRLQEAN
jgi:hypothetical protein